MAVLDFLKKKKATSGSSDQTTAQTDKLEESQKRVVTETVTEEKTVSGGRMEPYSGIGRPPGGGEPYSGIGRPPAPRQPVEETTTTVTTEEKPQKQEEKEPPAKEEPPAAEEEKKEETTPPSPLKSTIDQKKRGDIDLMTHLTQRSNRVFVAAQNKAKELKNEFVDSEHLLHGLLTDPEIYKLFTELKITPQTIEQELTKLYKKGKSKIPPQMSPRVKRILDNSLILARKLGFDFISPEHILLSLYEEGEGVGARVLAKLGVKKEDLNKKILGKKEGLKEEEAKREKSAIIQFTVDLTAKAAQGLLDPVVERSDIIERVIHILSRRTKNNPALVGEAGVGKTAVVEGLAQKIVKKEAPEPLLDKKVLQLDLMSVIAGASHRGEFEERMKRLVEEVKSAKGQIILFIDEIHNLVGAGAGGEAAVDASSFLKPSLARGELQVIGATTLTEYRRYIEKDPALERRFQPVLVPEPTEEQSIKMLKAIRDRYEAFHRVKIPDEVIESAVRLSKRYVGDRFLPDKAVDLMDEAGSAVRLPLISLPEEIRSLETRLSELTQELQDAEKLGNRVKMNILKPKIDDLKVELDEKKEEYTTKKGQTTTAVSVQIIKDIVSRWTGIPISKITESEVERLKNLEEIMHKRLINQEVAVSAVAEAVRRGRAGLKSTKRPIGSFVFLGPTGVGKTELAKTLAEILFGQEEAIVRLDMTEFMERHEVAKLLGAPPGYVGYEEGGKLTESVRRRPYSVVLFDEIEKAHPDVFNILLQILDDGRLTDNKSRTISFKNTVVICTSNIGTKMIQDEMLKTGKMEIEEPPVLSTYTFSPRGREILTIMGKIFEREPKDGGWKSRMLLDYFAGQKIEAEDEKQDEIEFPNQGFDTHAISPKGVEVITNKEVIYYRTSTTTKIWKTTNLIDYFKDHVVINALPDAPEQQLPTAKLKTNAYSPDEWQITSYKDRYWRRRGDSNNWETGTLKEYFKDEVIEEAKVEEKPITKEMVGQESSKADGQSKGDGEAKNEKEEVEVKETTFPLIYWDIHCFSPDGRELIIVGDKIWTRQDKSKTWHVITLKEYFGKDFPLEKELEEKRKVEEEIDKTQYEKTKSKVLQELRKFFRPELINRFDDIVVFDPLKYHHMLQIVNLQLNLVKKLLEEQNMSLVWTEAAKKEIVRVGFDPIYGARPLKRTIQKLIENPLSTLIIEEKLKEGDQVVVDFDGENFIFNIEKVELVAEEELPKEGIKRFFCEACGNNFETETVKNSTVVCSNCASDKVQEVIEKREEVMKDEEEEKEEADKQKKLIEEEEEETAETEEEVKKKEEAAVVQDKPAQPVGQEKKDDFETEQVKKEKEEAATNKQKFPGT